MLRFELDVEAADLASRTIEGIMVPYGEAATVDGVDYRFRAGSARLARSRMPLLVDHNRSDPVGVLAGLEERDDGALARFRVDETPAGDVALVQAASGSRGGLSIGASLDETVEADGVVDVLSASILECSLVSLGAFESATVTRVAAAADEQETEPAEPEPAPEPDPDQTELPVEEPEQPSEPAEPAEEGNTMENLVIAERAPAAVELGAGELVCLMIRAQKGNADAVRYLEGALQESISTDVTGLLPPTYEKTVLGAKATPRPLYNAFASRPLPGVGLQVNKPVWTTPPDGAWATTVDDDAHSTKVVIGSQSAVVLRWDWAGAIPWVVVQRSDPSIVDEVYAAAVQDFYYDVEAKVYGELGAAAPATSTTLGAAIAEFWVASNGRAPEVIIVAPDVWGDLADAKAIDSPAAAGAVSPGELRSTFAGIPIVASGALPAGEADLATRRAIDARITDPVRLTANAIGALNVELAVVGEGLFDTDYPAELLKVSALTPLSAGAARATKRSSS